MNIKFTAIIRIEKKQLNTASDLTQAIVSAITSGYLAPGDKFPSINTIAKDIGLNRLTVLKSMDELEIEGWVIKKERSGVFVSHKLPKIQPVVLSAVGVEKQELPPLAGNSITELQKRYSNQVFNDGYPDFRLFPVQEMARAYSTTLKDEFNMGALSYGDVYGQERLRNSLSDHIRHTRGIKSDSNNVLVTKGSTMGIYLSLKSICAAGDHIIMSKPGYYLAAEAFKNEQLNIHTVAVNEQGIDTDQVKAIVSKVPVKLVYITPHHHYPTTVTMSAQRRIALLQLAYTYGFYIVEDDYDFEFQYDRRPILPIASIDQLNQVIYIGGFSKSLSPSIRVGYIIAHEKIIAAAGKWRKIIDRQGDSIQELAFAKLLNNGLIEKVIRKAVKLYKERRDHTIALIRSELNDWIKLKRCDGGLAFWANLKMNSVQLQQVLKMAEREHVLLIPPSRFDTGAQKYTRLGFASMNNSECETVVATLKQIFQKL